MNGVVERWIGSTETIARSILYEARLPHQLWDDAIEHAFWTKNRVSTAALPFDEIKQKTPFEAYYNKIPSLKISKSSVIEQMYCIQPNYIRKHGSHASEKANS
ncbi:hypothetical protein K3495_g7604 [Podosphaera aphanis]|nr:hypothetical protein K3495_g7604 [Podosphaera aphanis]